MFAVKEGETTIKCSSVLAILQQIAKATYLSQLMFGKTAEEALQIVSWIQLAEKAEWEELMVALTQHLALRTFLVGRHVTAADLIVLLPVLKQLSIISDYDKLNHANIFRWADHIQNLPGVREEIERAELFVSFPDQNSKPPSKSELKKLAKMKAAQEKKEGKKQAKAEGAAPAKKEEEKKEEAKQEKGETKKQEQEQKPKEEGEKKPKQKQQQQPKP